MTTSLEALERIETERRRHDAARLEVAHDLLRTALEVAPRSANGTEYAYRSARAEIATALRMSERATDYLLDLAERVVERYPRSLAELRAAAVSLEHVRVIVQAGTIISDDARRTAYEEAVHELARALTPAQLKPHARRLAEQFSDRTIDERHAEAHDARSVCVRPLDDGMAELVAVIGAVEAAAIADRIHRIAARTMQGTSAAAATTTTTTDGPADRTAALDGTTDATAAPDARSKREVEADVFVDLLLSGVPNLAADSAEGVHVG